jgi:hypothetical protein
MISFETFPVSCCCSFPCQQELLGAGGGATETDDDKIIAHDTLPTKLGNNVESEDEEIDDDSRSTKVGDGKNPKKRGMEEKVGAVKKSAREAKKPSNYANEQENTRAQALATTRSKGLT